MKRLILALLVGGALFGTVFAAAAALNFGGADTLQAGVDTDLTCTSSPVQINWKTMVTQADFRVAGAEVVFSDNSCDGQKVLIATQSAPGAQNGFFEGTVVGNKATLDYVYSGGWVLGTGGAGPKAEDVNLVSVLVKNAWVAYDGSPP
jgi:hypothetical protein